MKALNGALYSHKQSCRKYGAVFDQIYTISIVFVEFMYVSHYHMSYTDYRTLYITVFHFRATVNAATSSL